MIRSMTGFGRAEVAVGRIVVGVETRAVNHRHLDITLRLPRTMATLEMEARRLVQSRVDRGRIDVSVQLETAPGTPAQQIRVDRALAEEYVARARELGHTLGLAGDPTLAWVLDRPGVTRLEDADGIEADELGRAVGAALERALDDLVARREVEGAALASALRALHADLQHAVEAISTRAPEAVARREARVRERIRKLLGEAGLDESRLLTEVAIWADKADVTEELTRLRAHLAEFLLLLDKGGAVGRPMDFLLQELNREVNTVAAKADDLELSQIAIGAKGTLEKIREQVQNLE